MALVEKNDFLNGRTVKMKGMTISWDDEEEVDAERPEGLELEPDIQEKPAEKKILKVKNEDQKTKKVII